MSSEVFEGFSPISEVECFGDSFGFCVCGCCASLCACCACSFLACECGLWGCFLLFRIVNFVELQTFSVSSKREACFEESQENMNFDGATVTRRKAKLPTPQQSPPPPHQSTRSPSEEITMEMEDQEYCSGNLRSWSTVSWTRGVRGRHRHWWTQRVNSVAGFFRSSVRRVRVSSLVVSAARFDKFSMLRARLDEECQVPYKSMSERQDMFLALMERKKNWCAGQPRISLPMPTGWSMDLNSELWRSKLHRLQTLWFFTAPDNTGNPTISWSGRTREELQQVESGSWGRFSSCSPKLTRQVLSTLQTNNWLNSG